MRPGKEASKGGEDGAAEGEAARGILDNCSAEVSVKGNSGHALLVKTDMNA